MENKKQEAIRLAYGEKYESAKNILDDNGWCSYQLNDDRELIEGVSPKEMEFEYNNFKHDNANLIYYWRPKSLSGLENNRGWISIESEEDLPKEKIYVYLIDKIKGFDEKPYPFNPNIDACKKELIRHATHYQPIQKPKNPIF